MLSQYNPLRQHPQRQQLQYILLQNGLLCKSGCSPNRNNNNNNDDDDIVNHVNHCRRLYHYHCFTTTTTITTTGPTQQQRQQQPRRLQSSLQLPCHSSKVLSTTTTTSSTTSSSSLSSSSFQPIKRNFSTNNNNNNNNNSSVSKEEVSKFSALASNWYDSTSNPLIGMNPARLSFITNHLLSSTLHPPLLRKKRRKKGEEALLKGIRVLDVGCGGGLLSTSLANLGADVVAVDPSVTVVNVAQQYYLKSKKEEEEGGKGGSIEFRGGISVEELAQEILTTKNEEKKELFDVVCVLEVIEHTSDPQSLLSAASSLLKRPSTTTTTTSSSSSDDDDDDDNATAKSKGGTLFISTINQTIKSYTFAILGAEYLTRTLPVGTHSYSLFRSPEQVEHIMKSINMKQENVCGMVVEQKPSLYMWKKEMKWKLDRDDLDVNWIGAYGFDDDDDDVEKEEKEKEDV